MAQSEKGYVTKTVKTSDIDVYQELTSVLSHVNPTSPYFNPENLKTPLDATLLFLKEPMKHTDLLALKLCAQCFSTLKPANANSPTDEFSFTHTYLNSNLLNLKVSASWNPGFNLANTAYGTKCFLQLTELIEERLSVLKDFIPNVTTTTLMEVRQPNIRHALLSLIQEYLPNVVKNQMREFKHLVSDVELSNLIPTLNSLGELLTYLSTELSFQFSTVNAAFSMLVDTTNPVDSSFLDCLDPLFVSNTSNVYWIQKLYDYLVGHELTMGMCKLLEDRSWLSLDREQLKLKTRLLKLIDISNSSEHENFFRQLLAALETHCTSSKDLSCHDRMETCKKIMIDLGLLHFVLLTGKLPYQDDVLIPNSHFIVVPSTAEALFNMLDMAEVSYIQLRAPEQWGLLGRLLRRITTFIETHSTLLSLILAGALLYSNATYVPSETISDHLYRRGLDANNLKNLDYTYRILPNSDPKYVSMCTRRLFGYRGSPCKLLLNDLNITREYPDRNWWGW